MRSSRPQATAGRHVGRLADRRLERAARSGTRASYNDSQPYLRLVLAWLNAYRGSVVQVADITNLAPTSSPSPTAVPRTVGQPVPRPIPTIVTGTGSTTAAPRPSTRQPSPPIPTTTAQPAPPPTTTTVPPPPPAQDPVSGLLCGVGDVLDGLLGLAPRPPPGCPTGTG